MTQRFLVYLIDTNLGSVWSYFGTAEQLQRLETAGFIVIMRQDQAVPVFLNNTLLFKKIDDIHEDVVETFFGNKEYTPPELDDSSEGN